MPNERAERLAEIVKSALEGPLENRAALLAEGCGSDSELRAKVEALLGHQGHLDYFMQEPALHQVAEALLGDEASLTGEVAGQYEILSLIARGGMGEVYLAHDRQLQRKVALKLIRRGMNSREIARHFKREELLLASLNHPNIAQLYGGGVTADGLPFFAMEYVAGQRLDEHCEERRLPISERLQLFCKVCEAVTYAHQHLVIHRDLKPSNIRVNEEGEPKLLDFGIAKLLQTDASLPNETLLTYAGAMTPEYASPEQVRGEAIATTSDVYSLGVLLYRLLTGQSPYRTKTKLPNELARAITDQSPDRPSTVVAQNSHSALHHSRSLKGDLDNIVLRAMGKEPERRYESAAQFAEDIRRHLAGKPVIARKDTWSYRGAKFAQRNRVAVGVSALLILSLLAGVVATLWEARGIRQEEVNAERINSFLGQVLSYTNPQGPVSRGGQHFSTMTEVLDEAARRLDAGAFSSQPEIRADLEKIIADSYTGQGKSKLADEHADRYIALIEQIYPPNHPKALKAAIVHASRLFRDGKMAEADRLFSELLPRVRVEKEKGNLTALDLAFSLNDAAYLYRTEGDSHRAELAFRESLALLPQIPKGSDYNQSITRSTLASTLADQGKFDEALQTAREAVAVSRQTGQSGEPGFGFSLTVLGGFLIENGNETEAAAALDEGEKILLKFMSPESLWACDNARNQAELLYRQGRYPAALAKVNLALDGYRKSFGIHYDTYPNALIIKGLILNQTGHAAEAEKILREAVKLRTDSLPKDHFWVPLANDALGECLTTQGRYAEAEPLLLQSYKNLQSTQGPKNPRTLLARQRLAALYQDWGRTATANGYRD